METEHVQVQTSWSTQWGRLPKGEFPKKERNTMTYLWLEIESSPNSIRLRANVRENGETVRGPINLAIIQKEPSPLAIADLDYVLTWLHTYANVINVPAITLATMDEFMMLNKFIPYNRLVYIYGIEVVGYTSMTLCVAVKARNDSSLPSPVPTHYCRHVLWGDESRQPITVDRIFYDDVATVVFWTDGTKTVVKCAEGTKYDEYAAFCIALAKKIYGNNSALKRAIKNHARYSKKRQIEKKFNGAKDNFEKIETENKIEEAVRKYVEHIHKNLADAFQKEENKDA